jgi:serine/threonine protein kinase
MISGRTSQGFEIALPRSFSDYTVDSVIGRGDTSVVFKALRRSTRAYVALKAMDRAHFAERGTSSRLLPELRVVSQVSHPNIVRCHDITEIGDVVIVVLELCPDSLLRRIMSARTLTQAWMLETFRKIASAVCYLHDRGIAHGDLKPDNILLDAAGNPKLIDFGYCHTARVAGDAEKSGTLYYASPEIVRSGTFDTQKADVWSLGIVLFTMVCGKFPYLAKDDEELTGHVATGNVHYSLIHDKYIRGFIREMTTLAPEQRPTVREIVAHPLLAKWAKRTSAGCIREGRRDPMATSTL